MELSTTSGNIIGDVHLGAGNDAINISGALNGTLNLGEGDDVVERASGLFSEATIDGGPGHDIFELRNSLFAEVVNFEEFVVTRDVQIRLGMELLSAESLFVDAGGVSFEGDFLFSHGVIVDSFQSDLTLHFSSSLGGTAPTLVEFSSRRGLIDLEGTIALEGNDRTAFDITDISRFAEINVAAASANQRGSVSVNGDAARAFIIAADDVIFNVETTVSVAGSDAVAVLVTGDNLQFANTGLLEATGSGSFAVFVDLDTNESASVSNSGQIVGLIAGAGGDDTFVLGSSMEEVAGGDGIDTASYSGSSLSVAIDLQNGIASSGDAQGDTLTSIENLIGSSSGDRFFGDGGTNDLDGGAGNDVIWARGGDDHVVGGGGADRLIGQAGNDILDDGFGDDDLQGRDGGDTLIGGAGADMLDGGGGTDTADYSGSALTVAIDLQNGIASSGDAQGDTLASIENLIGSSKGDRFFGDGGVNEIDGGAGNDVIWGRSGNDILNGDGGADKLVGQTGNDILDGGFGNDFLEGRDGRDTLIGARGNDTLTGGTSFDTFVFSGNWDDDTVTDFEDGKDLLDFSSSGLSFGDLTISQVNADTLIEDAFGNSIKLQNTTATDVTEADFLF